MLKAFFLFGKFGDLSKTVNKKGLVQEKYFSHILGNTRCEVIRCQNRYTKLLFTRSNEVLTESS